MTETERGLRGTGRSCASLPPRPLAAEVGGLGERQEAHPAMPELSWGQLSAAVQQAGRAGGKKAAETLDQKIARAKREGQSADDVARLVNTPQEQGNTLVHRTCEVGDPDTLHVLLKHGGDPNVLGKGGVTPLLAGISSLGRVGPGSSPATKKEVAKYERLCRTLLEHPDFDRAANDGGQPTIVGSAAHFCVAQEFGRADALLPLLQLLLDNGFDANGPSATASSSAVLPALHLAVDYGHFKCAAALIEAGADAGVKASIDGVDDGKITALELCELRDKKVAADLKRLSAEHKAKVRVLGTAPSGQKAEPGSNDASESRDPAAVATVNEEELEARIREEAQAELKRQKNREKKKKKKKKAAGAAQPEPEAAVAEAGATASADGGTAAVATVGGFGSMEDLLDPTDIDIVMQVGTRQSGGEPISRARAVQALINHNGDAVEAVLELEGAIDEHGLNLMVEVRAAVRPAAVCVRDRLTILPGTCLACRMMTSSCVKQCTLLWMRSGPQCQARVRRRKKER
eukprot:COSAG05_NODE_810_length_7182_cov_5.572780_2_plen_518_part_00